MDANDPTGALASLAGALEIEKRTEVRFRIGLEQYAILRSQGNTRAASHVLSRIASEKVPDKSRDLLAALYEHMNPTPGPTPKMR